MQADGGSLGHETYCKQQEDPTRQRMCHLSKLFQVKIHDTLAGETETSQDQKGST